MGGFLGCWGYLSHSQAVGRGRERGSVVGASAWPAGLLGGNPPSSAKRGLEGSGKQESQLLHETNSPGEYVFQLETSKPALCIDIR